MHYFTPVLHTVPEPTPGAHADKFGGLPEGLPSRLWPVCAECGGHQSFIAQFTHDPERLDLGRPGRRLFLFQCADPEQVGVCETWDATSGANAALIVEPQDLTAGTTPLPAEGVTLETEVFVRDWQHHDDGIPVEQVPAYLSEDGRFDLTDDDLDKPCSTTQLGGVPFWVQGAEEVDHAQWRYIAQLDSMHRLGEDQVIDASNFGGGLAYVFVERVPHGATPRATMFWQC